LFNQVTITLVEIWNRKLHIYLGLYFLWFLWLFALSGLLLNHPQWQFASFWEERKQSEQVKKVRPPQEVDDLRIAQNLMQQLGLSGEIDWTTTRPSANRFDFRIVKPGQIIEVKTDLKTEEAAVHSTQTNGWGIVKMLHTFTGVRANAPNAERDWWATKIWSFSMDALSIGLVFLACSGILLWLKLKNGLILGTVILGSGLLSCGFFVFGLSWL
jgi:hypothetical protein